MPEKLGQLYIYCRDRLTGTLRLDERQRLVFLYDPEWLKASGSFPLSLSLPFRVEPYADDAARPFFANLLPEGDLRQLIARRLHISEQNIYGLLEKIGGDCAGAISILPHPQGLVETSGYRELDEDALHEVLAELPKRPFLAGEKGIRLSLAGAQNKLPVYVENDRIYIGTGNSPSTHILKPPIPGLDGSVENEAFCMALGRRMGLPVADALIRQNRDTILMVTRYDRKRAEDGTILRVHQEDFCQALGILPEQKYEGEGGPSLSRCFELLKEVSIRPAVDQRSLLGWVIFNVLIGNADAHAKNLSLLLAEPGPRLAPFYDIISTQVYPHLAAKMAMKIGGENRSDWLQSRHWERLADSIGLKRPYVLSMARNMASRIVHESESLLRAFEEAGKGWKGLHGIVRLAKKRSEKMQ
ncbi:MAG: type II toxin-antitoxin system HipA family toxin [Desulfobacteraceae bacterium]|nr:MAG: type II toxin-antitoxin system HipA family toxin [Desulfobacteraceae bacterium]